ncbi:hypothetical protein ACHAWF_001991 [Thalassiosira exigua]
MQSMRLRQRRRRHNLGFINTFAAEDALFDDRSDGRGEEAQDSSSRQLTYSFLKENDQLTSNLLSRRLGTGYPYFGGGGPKKKSARRAGR